MLLLGVELFMRHTAEYWIARLDPDEPYIVDQEAPYRIIYKGEVHSEHDAYMTALRWRYKARCGDSTDVLKRIKANS
jgi:hypothetical protein